MKEHEENLNYWRDRLKKCKAQRDRLETALREIRVRTDKADIQMIIAGVLPWKEAP